MPHRTVPLKLAPAGLVVDRHEIGTAGIVVHVHGASPTSACPACGLASSSVHSRYGRTLGDLPAHGRRLGIRLAARRFRCRNAACERRVFTERFAPDLIESRARRTSRLDVLTHAIALALGGRPGERLAGRLSMPVSADTLLRLLRRRAPPTPSNVRVVGFDDFAWLKGQRYGTIICDLERRRTIDLLPDREGGTVADWLAARPGLEIVCRDRGSGYREGAAKGAPQALKVADRWHLLENATAAFVEAVKRRMGDLRRAITGDGVDPEALSAAEKKQWAGWQRRDEVNGTVRSLHGQGHSIKGIVRTTGVSRQTVRRILAGTRDDVFRSRETMLDRWAERLSAEWGRGLSKRSRTLAAPARGGVRRQSARGDGTGDPKAARHRGATGEARCPHDSAAGPDHRASADAGSATAGRPRPCASGWRSRRPHRRSRRRASSSIGSGPWWPPRRPMISPLGSGTR